MKTLFGTVLNQEAVGIANAVIQLVSKNAVLQDAASGKEIAALVTTKTDADGEYSISVADDFEGYVIVPHQKIKNCKVYFGFAQVRTNSLHYNVVVETKTYDPHDLDMSGDIDLKEVVAWLKENEKDTEYRMYQLEEKLRMMADIIIPLILKKVKQ